MFVFLLAMMAVSSTFMAIVECVRAHGAFGVVPVIVIQISIIALFKAMAAFAGGEVPFLEVSLIASGFALFRHAQATRFQEIARVQAGEPVADVFE